MRTGVRHFLSWQEEKLDTLRALVASTVNGTAQGTALVPGFSNGLMLLAPLLRDRRKVLCVRGDYPSIPPPFALNGMEVVFLDPQDDGTIPMEHIEAALARERPGILAMSHVQWSSGYTIDLNAVSALCAEHDAWFLVDATQSWCAAPIDVQGMGIDLLGASGYKWPLAGFGNGFIHLAPRVLEALHAHAKAPMKILMPGHTDPIAFLRLHDALERIHAIGIPAIAAHIRSLTDHAVEKLSAIGIPVLGGKDPAHRAAILILEGDAQRWKNLETQGVRCMPRGKGVRIGPHLYNTKADIERLVEVLERI